MDKNITVTFELGDGKGKQVEQVTEEHYEVFILRFRFKLLTLGVRMVENPQKSSKNREVFDLIDPEGNFRGYLMKEEAVNVSRPRKDVTHG